MEEIENKDPELQMLLNNKEDGFRYRERRHDEWEETYLFYRSRVITNRLTQRQSVHIPLMKQQTLSLLKDIDDMPVLFFENLDNDEMAQVFKNEYWNVTSEKNNMELNDIIDKKQVLLFGRSFDQWQIIDGEVRQTIIDPMDILLSRYMNPADIHSSRYLIHMHIYVPLSTLENNEDYNQTKVRELKEWYGTEMGVIKVNSNAKAVADKNEKMRNMGVDDIDSPVLGETYVELTLHFVYRQKKGDDFEQIYLYVEAEDQKILMKKPLEEVIGETTDHFWRNHYPYESWGFDLEKQDVWMDGVGDIIRPANKILDAWASQMVENRTLRNFGMQFYDSTVEGFNPGTFNPVAWGWYPFPGNPNEKIKKVDIPELSESLDEMKFFIEVTEKATGATTTQQGAVQERQITLGEVQLALGEAKERTKGISKFYTPAWKRRGLLFSKLIEAGADKLDAVKIYKKGRNSSKLYTREIGPSDWMTKSGDVCRVWSQEEKNTKDTNALQKLNFAKGVMPMNKKLDEAYKRKVLEFTDALTPQETNDIMEEERRMTEMPPAVIGGVGSGQNSIAPTSSVGIQQPVQA